MPKSIIKYEGKDFYNDYCSNLKDFILLEYFESVDNEYVGKIATNDTIYPIEIEVHIPHTFPHNKMLFVTCSLSGYPHLIPFDRNNPQKGNWFCLNTAFAENPKAQLDEEFSRLRGWLRNNLRADLPRQIKNSTTQTALQIFNAYEGNNPDEINELSEKSSLTFVGDFAVNSENFNETFGYLYVVKHPSGKFSVFKEKEGTNEKLPYVLVNHMPADMYRFASWVDEFKWDKKLCDILLPNFKWREIDEVNLKRVQKSFFQNISDEEIERDQQFLIGELSKINVPQTHKEALRKEVDEMIKKNREYCEYLDQPIGSIYDIEEADGPEEEYYKSINKLYYFAIGIAFDDDISWFLVSTNLQHRVFAEYNYDLVRYSCNIKETIDVNLRISYSNIIGRKEIFGRGELHSSLSDKKIAIVGLGAIGSPIAEALARGGAKYLTLWDGDIVEAGNICRSVYDNADIGNAKAQALSAHLKRISPFCNVIPKGCWYDSDYTDECSYIGGNFYGNVNYNSQKEFLDTLHEYDIVIDCTASNELLHFLSYAATDVDLLSLCITNKATHMLCLSNHDGNPFEMRKHLLASIEQDTDNFYVEGTGCYSPTFLATSCDIQSLVNLCVRSIHRQIQKQGYVSSTIWHYSGDNIVADTFCRYQLDHSQITMLVPRSSIIKMRQLPVLRNGNMGYLLGGYNTNRNVIYVTSAISQLEFNEMVGRIRKLSNGIIDYIGNVCVGSHIGNLPLETEIQYIEKIAESKDVDTNNPLLATVSSEEKIDFRLYINGKFVPFQLIGDQTNDKQ